MEKKIQFLKEYKELCLKHRLEIRGCGECGSAWVGKLTTKEINFNKIICEKIFFTNGEIGFNCVRFATESDVEEEIKKEEQYILI